METADQRSRGAPAEDLDQEDAVVAIKEALTRIHYGSILITIHQGQVVGIETSTKVRLKPRQ